MLSHRDRVFLNKFLVEAYTELGYPEADALAEKTVSGLASSSTRLEAVTEVLKRCDRAQYAGGMMRLRADLTRDILAQYLSHESDRADTRLWVAPSGEPAGAASDLDEEFWSVYERRFRASAAAAAQEAESLRLLDRCDPGFLFSFYPLPDEAD